MNKNILIVLAGGVLIAVLVAVLVQASLKGNEPQVQVREEAKVEILVAAKDLKLGHKLGEGDLRWQKWPKGAVFSGAIVRKDDEKPEDVISGRLGRALGEEEPIMQSSILKVDGNYLAAALPPGSRAIAIGVNANTMAGGFVTPGDRVDIIMTYRPKILTDNKSQEKIVEKNLDKYAAETILENVRVLAVDQAASKGEDNVKVGRTVTLEVSLMDAEKLALAAEVGDLTLALRGLGDDEKTAKKWPVMTDARLTNIVEDIYAEIVNAERERANSFGARPAVSVNTTGEKNNNVRIYNGGAVYNYSAR